MEVSDYHSDFSRVYHLKNRQLNNIIKSPVMHTNRDIYVGRYGNGRIRSEEFAELLVPNCVMIENKCFKQYSFSFCYEVVLNGIFFSL
jgi:hypothetical protein